MQSIVSAAKHLQYCPHATYNCKQTRSHAKANAFTCTKAIQEICTPGETRLHPWQNAFARLAERVLTLMRTRVRYTLHLGTQLFLW